MFQDDRSGEVIFAQHVYEFIRFYNKQRLLCDRMSGLKKQQYVEDGVTKFKEITKFNFDDAIKTLSSFIIDNIHYIKDKNKRLDISKSIKKLKSDYYDSVLNKISKEKYLNSSEHNKMSFNKVYYDFLFQGFELSVKVGLFLQDSLMISTREIKKSILKYDLKQFYENLSKYRDEMSNDLADYSFADSFEHYKKILGYVYTYKLMLDNNLEKDLDKLVSIAKSYLLKKKLTDLIIKHKTEKDNLTIQEKQKIQEHAIFIEELFYKIYELVNQSLSNRNILPKPRVKVLVDKTLI